MEETRAARPSSGIYETNQESTHSFHSRTSLRGLFFSGSDKDSELILLIAHAAPPAGVATITNADIIHAVTPQNAVNNLDDQPPPAVVIPVPAPVKQPFYKKRWFIISQIIIIPIGIALLFILLFPVIRAIVELVIKRTNLHVDLANITQPQNGS